MDLSILIPARNEQFLNNTIDDILQHREADTEIIVVLDGSWPETGKELVQHERLNVIYVHQAIGQRACTNLAAKLAKGKYVMKLDAHCSFDQGFDRKMIEMYKKTGDNVTMVPIMRNLWACDWKCYHCGKKWYQDAKPEICDQCNKGDKIKMKMLWIGKRNPSSTSYAFNSDPRFIYFEDWKHRPQYEKDKKELGYTETMSLQGSCFMTTRKNYWDKELCDESFGSWGNQGIEVACKTWMSGGRVLVNHTTWYAHLFRTKTDFGFPWPVSGKEQQNTKQRVKDFLWSGKYMKQVRSVKWIVEKFWPIPGWTQADLSSLPT